MNIPTIQFKLKEQDYKDLEELRKILEEMYPDVVFESINDFSKRIVLNRIRTFQKKGV